MYLRNKLVPGTLWNYNLEYNVAVIIVMGFRIMRTAEFHNQMQIEPQREVVAVGRVFESGKLMATTGIVTGKESKLDCNELMVTTCKITKVHAFFLLFLPSFEYSPSFCTKIFQLCVGPCKLYCIKECCNLLPLSRFCCLPLSHSWFPSDKN